ncbi:hypothetical protein LTR08_004810 [Meristemomyces frigidus]|nr:hypothetical protein LTR08_004810 [Meristemomyces frigidus]
MPELQLPPPAFPPARKTLTLRRCVGKCVDLVRLGRKQKLQQEVKVELEEQVVEVEVEEEEEQEVELEEQEPDEPYEFAEGEIKGTRCSVEMTRERLGGVVEEEDRE